MGRPCWTCPAWGTVTDRLSNSPRPRGEVVESSGAWESVPRTPVQAAGLLGPQWRAWAARAGGGTGRNAEDYEWQVPSEVSQVLWEES